MDRHFALVVLGILSYFQAVQTRQVFRRDITQMGLIEILGFTGMMLLLAAFVFNQIGWFRSDSYAYHGFNVAGAYLLTYYAVVLGNTPFIILEFVWGSFALFKLGTKLFGENGKP